MDSLHFSVGFWGYCTGTLAVTPLIPEPVVETLGLGVAAGCTERIRDLVSSVIGKVSVAIISTYI